MIDEILFKEIKSFLNKGKGLSQVSLNDIRKGSNPDKVKPVIVVLMLRDFFRDYEIDKSFADKTNSRLTNLLKILSFFMEANSSSLDAAISDNKIKVVGDIKFGLRALDSIIKIYPSMDIENGAFGEKADSFRDNAFKLLEQKRNLKDSLLRILPEIGEPYKGRG